MRVVKKYTDSFSANLAKGMLANNGIESFVSNTNLSFITGVANTDLISIDLLVADEDYSAALKLLEASSSAE